MNIDIVLRTIFPLLLLIGMGFLSRKIGVLRSGDERVLNAYVYYFALPALFVVELSESFTAENLRFILAGIAPIFIALTIYAILFLIFRPSKDMIYLLILSTIFGSTAFFGIPFITFAFPEVGYLATLSAASINGISVPISIMILEFYKLEETTRWNGMKRIAKRFSKNPLILSIFFGVLLSLIELRIPPPVSTALRMLGSTTSVVAIFMLGVFLYGRKYTNIVKALRLSLLRAAFLPTVALLTSMVFTLSSLDRATVVLMHGMPVAISMIILSERYDFHKETIASLILISSIAAGFYLNLWLLLLG